MFAGPRHTVRVFETLRAHGAARAGGERRVSGAAPGQTLLIPLAGGVESTVGANEAEQTDHRFAVSVDLAVVVEIPRGALGVEAAATLAIARDRAGCSVPPVAAVPRGRGGCDGDAAKPGRAVRAPVAKLVIASHAARADHVSVRPRTMRACGAIAIVVAGAATDGRVVAAARAVFARHDAGPPRLAVSIVVADVMAGGAEAVYGAGREDAAMEAVGAVRVDAAGQDRAGEPDRGVAGGSAVEGPQAAVPWAHQRGFVVFTGAGDRRADLAGLAGARVLEVKRGARIEGGR
jgi:hypothetical protein